MVHRLQSAILANGVFISQDPLKPRCLRDLGSLSHNHDVITSWIHDKQCHHFQSSLKSWCHCLPESTLKLCPHLPGPMALVSHLPGSTILDRLSFHCPLGSHGIYSSSLQGNQHNRPFPIPSAGLGWSQLSPSDSAPLPHSGTSWLDHCLAPDLNTYLGPDLALASLLHPLVSASKLFLCHHRPSPSHQIGDRVNPVTSQQ